MKTLVKVIGGIGVIVSVVGIILCSLALFGTPDVKAQLVGDNQNVIIAAFFLFLFFLFSCITFIGLLFLAHWSRICTIVIGSMSVIAGILFVCTGTLQYILVGIVLLIIGLLFISIFGFIAKSAFEKKDYLWHKVLEVVKDNPKTIILITVLDVGFLAIFLLLGYFLGLLVPTDATLLTEIQKNTAVMLGFMLLVIIYLLLSVFIYSFFSLLIMGHIKKTVTKHVHDFSKLKHMFLLNLFLFGIFFLVLILFNVAGLFLINRGIWLLVVFFIVFLLLFVLSYILHGFMHAGFILGHSFIHNFKQSFKHLFSRAYVGIVGFTFLIIGAYIVLYTVMGLLFKDFIVINYGAIINISTIVMILVVYVLFAFNRIYFYVITEKHFVHEKQSVTKTGASSKTEKLSLAKKSRSK